ncbi:MAG TPA: histidinol-phosphatase HisJ family protein [Clostridiales bacterium]|jgi:histidinol-phosphatase (PHP family)|nr:histidinol-phosphatase HisJ family protein [Clostridiales bacterium]
MKDYHIHSHFSADSNAPMADMASAAESLGITEIAFTDHYDPDYAITGWPSTLDFAANVREMEETAAAFRGRLSIRKGIEIGLQHGATLDKCRAAARGQDYDFIIASFHCAEGMELSCGDFFRGRTANEAARAFYIYNLETLADYDDFDVIGHINGVDRYSPQLPTHDAYWDLFEELLRLIIDKGRGIEINTSSFRYKMGDHTTPTTDMLKLYRSLGGEIVTVGSDAHLPHSVGDHIDWGYDKLRELGFKYYTSFEQRKPIFHKL